MRFLFLTLLVPCFVTASAQVSPAADTLSGHADSIGAVYTAKIDSLTRALRRAEAQAASATKRTRLNPYFYRMLVPGTLYNDAVSSSLQLRWRPGKDSATVSPLATSQNIYQLMDNSSASLAGMYVAHPELFDYTDADIQSQDKLRQEVKQPISADEGLGKMAVPTDLGNDMAEPVAVKVHRPNFWKFWGEGSLHFQQNYYSENWYKGGDNNYSANTSVRLELKFDNQRKLTWHNRLDFQLGFQTSDDKVHKLRVTNNLLQLTSSLSYQAVKNWHYTGELKVTTQNLRDYNWESSTYKSGFFDPLYINLSVGMKYTYKSKKGKVWGELYLSPVSYDMRYVASDSLGLRQRHGIEDGHAARHNFGPYARWTFDWQIMKNVKWGWNMYFFTNFEQTQYQWENTIDFTINKYLNAKLYIYPRFDDSSPNYRSKKKDTYWMLQEWFSLGLTYKF